MANRTISVTLRANVQDFKQQFDSAAKAVESAAKATESSSRRASAYVQEHKSSINELSNAALGLGAGMLGGAALAAKAAMDWESAWAGVRKTVDGTDEEMASLEQGLRDMAKTLPASHQEIAAVAEAAGQLGIATPNIESFTRTMIDLGESSNLSAEEAATALARFMNVMGTSQADVGRLGAAVVGLGNNFATTESEIVAMAQRLSGAGAQAGLTEGDVLGLASAMSSVGIEAEAGGSAMSLTMKRIGKEVDSGGEKLELFAQVAGMSAQEFATAWKNDPAMALDAFITGLSGVEAQGMTTNGVLSELGITGIRESDALLRLSAASEQGADGMSLLAGAVAQGNQEFEDGTALVEEASKRYETAESRILMMRNAFVDAGIDIGGALAPVLADAADNVSFLVGKFQELPDSAKSALGMGAGAAGLGLLAVGALGKAVTAASDLKLAMDNLGWATASTSKKMKLLGVGSAAGLAITGLALAIGHFVGEAATAERHAEELADTFDKLTGAATADTDRLILEQLSETLETTDWAALEDLGVSVTDVMDAVKAGGPELEALRDRLTELGFSAGPEAQEAIGALERAIGPANEAFVEGQAKAAFMRDALGEVAGESGLAAEQQEMLQGAIEETGVALDGTIEKMSEFLDLLFETGLATMSAREAQSAYYETVGEVDEAIQKLIDEHGGLSSALNEAGTDFDLTTAAGRDANSAFQDIAKSGMDLTKALADNNATQDELQGSLDQTYDDLVQAAQGMGLSEQAANDLAREVLGIPDDVSIESWMSDEAERQAEATQRAINRVDRRIDVVTYFSSRGVPGVHYNGGSGRPGGMTATARATGGPVFGPGTGTSDSIPAMLSNGEHVLTAREVQAAGGHQAVSQLRASLLAGGNRYADGGPVGASRSVPVQAVVSAPAGGGGARDMAAISTAVRDGIITSGIGGHIQAGMERANVVATVSAREAAYLHQRGRSASRAYGGRG